MNKKPIPLDQEYKQLIQSLKQRVISARMRTMLAANAEQIKLYWTIGMVIIEQQKKSQWGSKLLEQVSCDLSAAFPDMKGFSVTNLKRMKMFANNYPEFEIGAQAAHQFQTPPQYVLATPIKQQPVAQLPLTHNDPSTSIGAQAVPQLPWGHIIVLIEKVKDKAARDWYAQQALEHGWARNVLIREIKSNLYQRQGQSTHKVSNIKQRLPAAQSDLADALMRDPYDFGFMPITAEAKEREIEKALIDHVREFLLSLGAGFAFIASQYHLEVGGEDFYIDLLLFHTELNCYVVVELKKGKFKPSYTGQLNFYLSVIDDTLKKDHHNPTLGLLLCEYKNKVVAEYALNRVESPMGISEYQLSTMIPQELANILPSTALLEDRLSQELNEMTHSPNLPPIAQE